MHGNRSRVSALITRPDYAAELQFPPPTPYLCPQVGSEPTPGAPRGVGARDLLLHLRPTKPSPAPAASLPLFCRDFMPPSPNFQSWQIVLALLIVPRGWSIKCNLAAGQRVRGGPKDQSSSARLGAAREERFGCADVCTSAGIRLIQPGSIAHANPWKSGPFVR